MYTPNNNHRGNKVYMVLVELNKTNIYGPDGLGVATIVVLELRQLMLTVVVLKVGR
jgi:hypothetical protein